MASNYKSLKCDCCAGALEYNKQKKVWVCLYCGNEIRREEEYDGLFTIKNVVKQSLLDTAHRRLDSAARNLLECEKIDSRYVGTLIAKIAYEMITLITPGACEEREVRNMFSQLKRNYEALCAISTGVSDEEDALYEFLEEADIFATLVLVYDSLNDSTRRDYVLQMLDAKQVYSDAANGNLLSYALKNGKTELADDVLGNVDNLQIGAALTEVFNKYPDGDKKAQHISRLIGTKALSHNDGAGIEKYLSDSADSISTKSAAIEAAVSNGIEISLEFVIRSILPHADQEHTTAIIRAFCGKKLCDDDVLKILNYACSCKTADTAVSVLDCLKESNQYVLVPGKMMIAMLSEKALDGSAKIKVLGKLFEFKMDAKNLESVVTNYLCFNKDAAETRAQVIPFLLEKVATIPTSTVQNYVLNCATDGEEKPAIVKSFFDKGLNTSFFNDLLSKYIATSVDSGEVKNAIIEILSGGGLKIDPGSLIDYICGSEDDVATKIQFVKKMVANGSQLRGDAANAYLERTPADRFSSELFTLICVPGSSFGPGAVERYLLYCRDRGAIKAQNFRTLAERCAGGVEAMSCTVSHLGNSVTCNLLQAYVLMSTDAPEVTFEIADWLISKQRMKINAEITASGKLMKFKKYVVTYKNQLSANSNAICEKYKVYTMLF